MGINEHEAMVLEYLVKKVYDEKDGKAFNGLVDADRIAKHPIWAAVLGLAPLYRRDTDGSIAAFMDKYVPVFENPETEKSVNFNEYYMDLSGLIGKLSN